jgi:hypothetical protein
MDAGPQVDPSTDDGGAPDGGFTPAPHTSFPQLTLAGGSSIASPDIVSVSFTGDTPMVHMFADWVVGSAWLKAVGKDYGLTGALHAKSVTLTPAPNKPLSGDDVQALLTSAMKSGDLPAPSAQTIYLVQFPAGTRVGYHVGGFDGPDSCSTRYDGTAIGGYHFNASADAGPYVYAVVPHCQNETEDELWVSASHELIEAATDPLPSSGYSVQDPMDAWVFTSGEAADLCDGHWTTEGGHTVQRVYSNSAAAASTGSPCVPAPSEPYYGLSATRDGPSVAAGASVQIPMQAWSSQPTTAWTVRAAPVEGMGPGSGTFTPTVMLDAKTVNNGDVATLTVSVPAGAAPGDYGIVWVFSYRRVATEAADFSLWPVAVFAK